MKKSFKLIISLSLIFLMGTVIVVNGQITAGEDQMITDENNTFDTLGLPAGAIALGSLPFYEEDVAF